MNKSDGISLWHSTFKWKDGYINQWRASTGRHDRFGLPEAMFLGIRVKIAGSRVDDLNHGMIEIGPSGLPGWVSKLITSPIFRFEFHFIQANTTPLFSPGAFFLTSTPYIYMVYTRRSKQ
jgi:hypothetical protein